LFPLFATGVVDNGGEFAAVSVGSGGKLPPASLPSMANLPQVSLILMVHIDLQISLLSKKFCVIFRSLGEDDSWKNL
jgi:hypothetical protein